MSSFEKLLARDGVLVYKIKGTSMEPMLRQDRDLVVIRVPASRLRKYDVAFYKRGELFILHRVIAVKDDFYLIRGDNTYALETVPDSDVLGVLTSFQRKGKHIETTSKLYLFYVRFWNAIYPLRRLRFRVRRRLIRVARKLGLLPIIKKALGRRDAT